MANHMSITVPRSMLKVNVQTLNVHEMSVMKSNHTARAS